MSSITKLSMQISDPVFERRVFEFDRSVRLYRSAMEYKDEGKLFCAIKTAFKMPNVTLKKLFFVNLIEPDRNLYISLAKCHLAMDYIRDGNSKRALEIIESLSDENLKEMSLDIIGMASLKTKVFRVTMPILAMAIGAIGIYSTFNAGSSDGQ
ncbi:MAG: hypothetical protein WCT85_01625 [Parachlamydiales bacterium]|jgi:hypothetical protein